MHVHQAAHSGTRMGVFTSYSAPGGLREGLLCREDEGGDETREAQPLCEDEGRDHALAE